MCFEQGRIDKFDIAQAIKSEAALDSDLIPGEYEGKKE